MKHTDAMKIAKEFLDYIKDLCIKVEIVGSLKRMDKINIGDIELLLILDPEGLRLAAENDGSNKRESQKR